MTTILDDRITKIEIYLKYFTRWDIEISIREIKSIMRFNVLRGQTPEMALKELSAGLIAYNYIRRIIVKSVEKTDFSPKTISFKSTIKILRLVMLTSLGGNMQNILVADKELLFEEIRKNVIPSRPNRMYPRKLKKGAYKNLNNLLSKRHYSPLERVWAWLRRSYSTTKKLGLCAYVL